ncbi:uncharacterized protein [Brachyistius frenatus]|uniref:uncharacterized protein isoform X2 n=1 Tax=Brachyistius frenatus TaxID=100188 RepID=UPI0037E86AF7
MTGLLLFVILIYSFFEIEVKALLPPKLTVSRSVITETESVTLSCEAPPSVSVSKCHLYTLSGGTERDVSCQNTLTGTELLEMANRRSPAEIKINCLYRAQQPEELWSPYSDIFSITVQTPLPPELTVNPPVVTETDSVTLNCQTPPSVSVSQCHFYTLSGGTVREFPCQNTLTGTELLAIANLSSPAEVKVNCYYIVKHPSPYSNLSSITIQRTNQKEERTTYVTTFFPSEMSPTGRDTRIWKVVVVLAGCGVAMGVIFLGFTLVRNQRRTGAVEPNRQEPQNNEPTQYKLYSTIPDEPAASAMRVVIYNKVEEH